MGDYDEHLVFFTKDYGKIHLHSFGSRSPKSSRRRHLAKRDFLVIEGQSLKGRYQLKQLELLKQNDFLENHLAYELFFLALKTIDATPELFRDSHIYQSLVALASPAFFQEPHKVLHKIVIYLTLLKGLGTYPYFSQCGQCGKTCRDPYTYHLDTEEYYGAPCRGGKEGIPLGKNEILFLNRFYEGFKNETNFFIQAVRELDKKAIQKDPLEMLSSKLLGVYP